MDEADSSYQLDKSVLEAAKITAKAFNYTLPEMAHLQKMILRCQKHDENSLRALLQSDPNLSVCRFVNQGYLACDGQTPLHVAASNGNLETLKILLEVGKSYGASAWICDLQGRTPLHVAAEKGKLEVCKYLKEIMQQERFDPIGINAPVDLAGTTPLGSAKVKSCGKPQNKIDSILFAPGDRSILPRTPKTVRTWKSPWKPTSSNQLQYSTGNAHLNSDLPRLIQSVISSEAVPSSQNMSTPLKGLPDDRLMNMIHSPLLIEPDSAPDLLFGFSLAQGWQPYMEDKLVAKSPIMAGMGYELLSDWSMFSIFDGHGGEYCSSYLAAHLPRIIAEESLRQFQSHAIQSETAAVIQSETAAALEAILVRACQVADETLQLDPRMVLVPKNKSLTSYSMFDSSGSTGNVVLITKSHLVIANVGDSRSVLAQFTSSGNTPPPLSEIQSIPPMRLFHSPTSGDEDEGRGGGLPSQRGGDKSSMDVIQSKLGSLSLHDAPRYQVVELSIDHKLSLPAERDRALAAGARSETFPSPIEQTNATDYLNSVEAILPTADPVHPQYEVFSDRFTFNNDPDHRKLRLSRSFGDFYLKLNHNLPADQQAVIAVPDVVVRERSPRDGFLVVACDGVWDVMSNEEVVAFVGSALHRVKNWKDSQSSEAIAEACDELLHQCLLRGSEDNLSVIVVVFTASGPHPIIGRSELRPSAHATGSEENMLPRPWNQSSPPSEESHPLRVRSQSANYDLNQSTSLSPSAQNSHPPQVHVSKSVKSTNRRRNSTNSNNSTHNTPVYHYLVAKENRLNESPKKIQSRSFSSNNLTTAQRKEVLPSDAGVQMPTLPLSDNNQQDGSLSVEKEDCEVVFVPL